MRTEPPPFEIWYQVSNYPNSHLDIKEIRICRSTKESVWELHPPLFKGQDFIMKREKRDSQGHVYFPTLDEAKAHLKKRAEKMKVRTEEILKWANDFLEGKTRVRKCQPFPEPSNSPANLLV